MQCKIIKKLEPINTFKNHSKRWFKIYANKPVGLNCGLKGHTKKLMKQ